jgi:ATP-dependent Lon protease
MKESAGGFFRGQTGADNWAFCQRYCRCDYHIHVPAGAVPKDGPSAGVAMFTSLVSLMRNIPAMPDVAMTGEITLKGLVLPMGIERKILAANRLIKTVILPSKSKRPG